MPTDRRVDGAHDVIIVGAGIAGLAAGFRLREQGLSVLVLEAADAVGGKMSSIRRDGWTLNRAATILPSSYATLQKLITDAGGTRLERMETRFGIPRAGTMHTVRANGIGQLIDGLSTKLIGPRSKLLMRRVAVDAFKMRKALTYDSVDEAANLDVESVAEYIERRLNDEVGQWMLGPLLRGIFLQETDEMSVVDLYFTLINLVGGGLLRYPAGIDFLARLLAQPLDVRVGARVEDVKRLGDSVEVSWQENGQQHFANVQGCVIAVCGKHVSGIYPELDPRQREILDSLPYTAITKGIFGLSKPVDHAAPTVIAVPRSESSELGVICCDSRSMPTSVPAGKGAISGHWMTDWTLRNLDVGDEDLVPKLFPAMEEMIPGISNLTEFVHIERWSQAAVAPGKGVYKSIAEIRRRIDPNDRVQLAGDYLGQSGTNLSARTGEQAAERLATTLSIGSGA